MIERGKNVSSAHLHGFWSNLILHHERLPLKLAWVNVEWKYTEDHTVFFFELCARIIIASANTSCKFWRDCIPLFMNCVSHLKPRISSFSFLFHVVVEKLTSNSCSCLAKMARLRKFWFCRWLKIMHECDTTIQSHFCRKTRVRCGGMFNGMIFPCDVGFYVQQYKFEQARLTREWLLPWFPCSHCRCHLHCATNK